jgi:hypothetical protein
VPYHESFALDAIGQPTVGVTTGGYFGTGVVGGINAMWGDQLGDQVIYSALQANGTLKDFGGALFYQNLRRRLNWMAGIQHIPYLTGFQQVGVNPDGTYDVLTTVQRIYVDQASLAGQYPFSTTRRFELGASVTRLGFEQQQILERITPGGVLLGRQISEEEGLPGLNYAQGTAAFVGDNSFGGFTSPISGTRYRFEMAPTFGSVNFNSGLADMRRYLFFRPFTLAFRALHYGRYGRDADNYDRLSPIFLGEETLMRGYGYGSLTGDECVASTGSTGRCPVFDRMIGSRVAVINTEFRIPLFGTSGFGLVNFPYLPLEVSPFFDGGIAWTGDQAPQFRFVSESNEIPTECQNTQTQSGLLVPCAERIPIFSAGLSLRANILGYMILETYIAKPFQRPRKDWVIGFQLAPGW